MKNILIVGGGSHCLNVIDLLLNEQRTFKPVGIIDSHAKPVLKIPIIGEDKDLKKLRKTIEYAFIGYGIGTNINLEKRKILFESLLRYKYKIPNLISDRAFVRSNVKLGIGNFIQAGSILDTSTRLKDNIVIGHNVVVGHSTSIMSHSVIGGSVNLNGGIKIGNKTFIGMNCSILKSVGNNCKISPGVFSSEKILNNFMVFDNKPHKIKLS